MPKMAAEECFDSVPTVFGSLGIVFGLHRADFSDPRQKSAVAAHEAVTRLFVDFDVVVDAHLGQQLFEPASLRREDPVVAAVASEHGTYAAQLVGGFGHVAVESRGDAEGSAGRVHQRETAAHTEADHSDARRVDARLL